MRRIFRSMLFLYGNSAPKYNFIKLSKFPNTTPKTLMTPMQYQFSKTVIELPGLGDSITEGTIYEIKKNVGDYVEADQIVYIVETDKV